MIIHFLILRVIYIVKCFRVIDRKKVRLVILFYTHNLKRNRKIRNCVITRLFLCSNIILIIQVLVSVLEQGQKSDFQELNQNKLF